MSEPSPDERREARSVCRPLNLFGDVMKTFRSTFVGPLGWLGIGALAALSIGCEPTGDDGDAVGDGTSDATDTRDSGAADGNDASDATGTRDATDTRNDSGGDSSGDASPTLESATAHVAGAKGLDLALELVGKDADRDASHVRVRVFDGAGAPVLAFATGLTTGDDSNEQIVAFAAPVSGQLSFTATARLRNVIGVHPEIARVEVALRDTDGHFSDDLTVDVATQELRQLDDSCDPDVVVDRCTGGLGCSGTPPTCREGVAPELTRVAFLKGTTPEAGARILAQGTDPEEDIASLKIEFLDSAGSPVTVDLDNDEVPDSTEFLVSAADAAYDGGFFVRVDTAAGFETLVPQIAVTPIDGAGHQGVRKTARLAPTPTRAAGQSCDVNGFDACNATSVCSPGLVGVTNQCKLRSQLATAECKDAPMLTLDGAPITGLVEGPSVWEAPIGCSSGDPTGRPEVVVKLHLDASVPRLTLSTGLPGTNFDTVLYVLAGACPVAPAEAIGCADDDVDGGGAATLVLENLPAGDYLVVVDAWGTSGGSYSLAATID